MGLVVVIVSVIAVVGVVVVLARQGNPADLSEQADHVPGKDVAERPAGPDAEPMGVADPGRPSTDPEQER
jgi:hypothetical protein